MEPEYTPKMQEAVGMSVRVYQLIVALQEGKDPRYQEILSVMKQEAAERRSASDHKRHPGESTLDSLFEQYEDTGVQERVISYVDEHYPGLLILANLDDGYFHV